MKKLFILLSIVVCSIFVGCNKDNEAGDANSIVGTWVLTYNEGSYWSKGGFTFNSDGTFVEFYQDSDGENSSDSGTYTYENSKLSLFYAGYENDPDIWTVNISGNTMVMSDEDSEIVFYRQ